MGLIDERAIGTFLSTRSSGRGAHSLAPIKPIGEYYGRTIVSATSLNRATQDLVSFLGTKRNLSAAHGFWENCGGSFELSIIPRDKLDRKNSNLL